MPDISLAIFDLGNVLYPVGLEQAFAIFSRHSQLPVKHFADRNILDETFFRYEKGQISSEEYHAHFNQIMGTSLTYGQFVEGWNGIFTSTPFPEVVDAARKLARDMKVVALTNTNPLHSQIWPGLYADDLRHFHRIFASDTLGLSKPDPRIYELVLDACEASAEETIYFDDIPDFVKAAAGLGIHAVQVNRPSDITDELRRLGLL